MYTFSWIRKNFRMFLFQSVVWHWYIATLIGECIVPPIYIINSSPLNVVNQYDSTTVNQRIIETMLFPVCMEWLSWLSVSIHHRFCKPLVRCTYEQARKCLPKIAFPYWCLRQIWAVIGTYWHRIDTIVCISGKWKSGFRTSVFSNKVRTYNRPYFHSSFGQHWHRKGMLWELE